MATKSEIEAAAKAIYMPQGWNTDPDRTWQTHVEKNTHTYRRNLLLAERALRAAEAVRNER